MNLPEQSGGEEKIGTCALQSTATNIKEEHTLDM
jgi:hypothetical protein